MEALLNLRDTCYNAVEQTTVDHRVLFEELVYKLKSRAYADELKPRRCFLSYAWGDQVPKWRNPRIEPWVARLADDLRKAGHDVVLDQTHNEQFGQSIVRFVEQIESCDFAMVLGTPLYVKKYKNQDAEKGTVVAAEMDIINQRLRGTEAQKKSVIGLLLAGKSDESLPPLLRGRTYADFRNEIEYFATAFDLMLSLYGISFALPGISEWRGALRKDEMFRRHAD